MKGKNITFIHGFGGGPEDYHSLLEYFPKSHEQSFIRLPFHKEGEIYKRPYSLNELIETLFQKHLALWKNCDYICAYSMGGRISILLNHMLRLRDYSSPGLILISSALGFLKEREKKEREEKDKKEAQVLRKNASLFWQDWYKKSLFCSFQDWQVDKRERWIKRRLRYCPNGLASSLENWSPAKHSYLLPILQGEKKLLYIAGKEDTKYKKVARVVEKAVPGSCVKIVANAAHTVMEDRPEECAKLILDWIKK